VLLSCVMRQPNVNKKRAVESDRVVMFMRTRRNVYLNSIGIN